MSEEISLGALLREARERRGDTLEQAQQQTAISLGLLRELESDEFRVEPVYARLAAVNYAAYLGLDSEEATTRFDRQYGRPDIPAPSYSRDYGRSPFPVLSTRYPALIGPVAALWVIAGGAAIVGGVLLAIFLSGDPEEPAPPSAEAADTPPALPLADAPGEAEPGPDGAGLAPAASLETPSAPLAETSVAAADSAGSGGGEAVPADLVEEAEAGAVPFAAANQPDSGTALGEPEAAERPGVPDLAAPLVLRAEAIDSTWVRIEWDGGTGSRGGDHPRGRIEAVGGGRQLHGHCRPPPRGAVLSPGTAVGGRPTRRPGPGAAVPGFRR